MNFKLIALVSTFVFLSACAGQTGHSVPDADRIAASEATLRIAVQAYGGVVTGAEATESLVTQIGSDIAAGTGVDLPWEFIVTNSTTPRAWSLPGGKVVLSRGLITQLAGEAELAAVLAHLIAHSVAQDMPDVEPAPVPVPDIRSPNREPNFLPPEAGAALLSTHLPHSQAAEQAAGRLTATLLARAGYPETGWSALLSRLATSDADLSALASRHVWDPAAGAKSDAEPGDVSVWEQRIADLRASEPVYELIDRARDALGNDDLAAAIEAADEAIGLRPGEAAALGMRGEIALAQEDYETAREYFDRAISADADNYRYYLGRGIAGAELGDLKPPRDDLEDSEARLPTALTHLYLGDLYRKGLYPEPAKAHYEAAMYTNGEIFQRAADAYKRLDIVDRPQNYLMARPVITEERKVRAIVANPSDIPVRSVQFEFNAIVNGEPQSKIVMVGRLPPSSRGHIASGWTLGEDDDPTSVTVRPIALKLSRRGTSEQ